MGDDHSTAVGDPGPLRDPLVEERVDTVRSELCFHIASPADGNYECPDYRVECLTESRYGGSM